jgi:hypothetical protein
MRLNPLSMPFSTLLFCQNVHPSGGFGPRCVHHRDDPNREMRKGGRTGSEVAEPSPDSTDCAPQTTLEPPLPAAKCGDPFIDRSN